MARRRNTHPEGEPDSWEEQPTWPPREEPAPVEPDDDRPFAERLSDLIGAVADDTDAVEKRVRACLLNEGLPELYAEIVASDVAESWANGDPAPLYLMPGYEPPQNDPENLVAGNTVEAAVRAWEEKWEEERRRNPPRRRWRLIEVRRSNRPGKKLMAVFEDRSTGSTRTTHFGATGYEDFTTHKDPARRDRYLERHGRGREDWNDPTTPGALSRWLLWNKPTLDASLRDFKRRFGL